MSALAARSRASSRVRVRATGISRTKEAAPLAGLGATVILGPQLLAGAVWWAPSVILCLAASSWTLLHQVSSVTRPLPRRALLVLVGLGLWTLAQGLPAPLAVVERIAPALTQWTSDAGVQSTSWSAAPAATLHWLVGAAGVSLTAMVAFVLVGRGLRRTVALLVVASTTSVALASIMHALVDARAVYGLHQPEHTNVVLMGPVLNANHFAGLMGLTVPILAEFTIRAAREKRAFWGALLAVHAGTLLLSGSRSGIIGTAVAVAFWAWSRPHNRRSIVLPASLGALAASAMLLGTLAPRWREGVMESPFEKAKMILEASRSVFIQPISGVGRGAFHAITPMLQLPPGTRADHPENILITLVAEWGVLAALVALASILIPLWRVLKRHRSGTRVALASGCLGLLAHDLADFALEMPGIAVVFAVAWTAAVSPSGDPVDKPAYRWRWLVAPAIGLAALAMTPIAAVSQPRTAERAMLALPRSERAAVAHRLTRWHPHEAAFWLHLADLEAAPAKVRYLNRAMALAPHWHTPHERAAAWLAQIGKPDQAWLELLEAKRRGSPMPRKSLCAVGNTRDAGNALVRLVAENTSESRLHLADAAANCKRVAEMWPYDTDLQLARRGMPHAMVRTARHLDGELRASRLDPTAALTAFHSLPQAIPDDARVYWSRTLLTAGAAEAARTLLERPPGSQRLQEALLPVLAALGEMDQMRRLADALCSDWGTSSAAAQARVWAVRSRLEDRHGTEEGAIAAMSRALRLDPSEPYARHLSALHERAGDPVSATRVRLDFCRSRKADGRPWCRAERPVNGSSRGRNGI